MVRAVPREARVTVRGTYRADAAPALAREAIFLCLPFITFIWLSANLLYLTPPLGSYNYRLTISALLYLFFGFLALTLLLRHGRAFRDPLVVPSTVLMLTFLSYVRFDGRFMDAVNDWFRVLSWIGTFHVASLVLNRPGDPRRVARLALLATVPPAALAVMSYVTGESLFWGWFGSLDMSTEDVVISPVLGARVARAAPTLLVGLLPFVVLVSLRERGLWRLSAWIILGVTAFATWFSYGRALLGSLIAFALVCMFLPAFRKARRYGWVVLVIVAVLVYADWEKMRVRFLTVPFMTSFIAAPGELIEIVGYEPGQVLRVDPSSEHFEEFERLGIWRYAIGQWVEAGPAAWLFGVGPGEIYDNGRNDLLSMVTEAGPLAGIGFLVFAGTLLHGCVRLLRNAPRPEVKELAGLAIAVYAGWAFSSLFEGNLRGTNINWCRALFWGMAFAQLRALRRARPISPTNAGRSASHSPRAETDPPSRRSVS